MNNENSIRKQSESQGNIHVNKDYIISLLSSKTYTCFVQNRGNYYFPVAFNVSKGHTRFRSRGTVPPLPPIVSRSLPGTCFLFHFLSRFSSLPRNNPSPLCLFLSLPLSFSSSSPPFLCLSPGRRKEALQEIHLQRRGTVQQNTNDIFTWRWGRNRVRWIYSGKVYRALRQRGEGGKETWNVFFERNPLIHSRSRAEVRPQFLPSSASDEFSLAGLSGVAEKCVTWVWTRLISALNRSWLTHIYIS